MSVKRVLVSGLFHETHTFLEGTTGLGDFEIRRGLELFECRGDSSPLGGVLEVAERLGWTVVPGVDYRAQPSAMVEDAVFEQFWAELEFTLGAAEFDAIYLVLHGAMVTVQIADVEGELLRRIRGCCGLEIPVFGVFDLHANVSPAMAAYSNGLVAYRENPHTDAREAACLAAALLNRSLEMKRVPVQRLRTIPVIWAPTGTSTAADPMRSLESLARVCEQRPGVWSMSVAAGFAFADTEFTGVSFIAFGENEAVLTECLDELESKALEMRALGAVLDPSPDAVLPGLKGLAKGLTVLVEPSDNIGGGAPGDGTGLLRALVEHHIGGSAICIADAAAVRLAEGSGVGSRLRLSVGGKGSSLDAGPVELEVEVVSIQDGRFELEDKQSHLASMSGDYFDMGRCAVVRTRVIPEDAEAICDEDRYLTVLLTSVKTPPFDLGQWRSQGIEPERLSVIGVKAAVAHRRAYDPIAARMFWVDTPGPCSSNLAKFPYRRANRAAARGAAGCGA